MQPADLELINSVSEPSLHPDGTVAVVAVTRPDFAADSYVGQLWTVAVPSGRARRLTRGFRDTAPRYSPDGTLIGFLRAAPGKPPQLYVLASGGGEPVQVTDRKLGVGEFRWSPDGSRLAFVSRDPEPGRYGTVDGLDAGAEPPRRITTLNYSQNGLGYDIDRRAQVFVVDVPDVESEPVVQPVASPAGKPEPAPVVGPETKITSADADHQLVDFAPDGKSVAVLAAVHPERDLDRRSSLLLVALDESGAASEPVDLTGAHGSYGITSAAVGSDGTIFFEAVDLGPDGLDFIGRSDALYGIDRYDQSSAPVRITDPEAYDLGGRILPRADGSVLVLENRRGTSQLLSVAADGTVTALTSGEQVISGFDATDAVIIASFSDPASFGDLGLVTDGKITALTDFSAAIRGRGLVRPKELTITGRDGYPVHGWLATPDDNGPGGDGPFGVLLLIHGGPFSAYSVSAFDETQVLVDAGYAVAYCNPRGSSGYGEDHGRAIRQAMGTVDLDDVLDFLDGAIGSDPRLDRDRTGILGGSYGGYLTAWTIAHDHRWRGAIVERGFLDPELFAGTSDIGSYFGQEYVGTDPDKIAAQSPQAHVGKVTTPTLLLHSELDLRCPLSQAERYYASLKRQGIETELVIFPGENHELSRAGRPRHRRQRFEIILDWWRRTLPDAQSVSSGDVG